MYTTSPARLSDGVCFHGLIPCVGREPCSPHIPHIYSHVHKRMHTYWCQTVVATTKVAPNWWNVKGPHAWTASIGLCSSGLFKVLMFRKCHKMPLKDSHVSRDENATNGFGFALDRKVMHEWMKCGTWTISSEVMPLTSKFLHSTLRRGNSECVVEMLHSSWWSMFPSKCVSTHTLPYNHIATCNMKV